MSDKARLQFANESSKTEALIELVKVANLGYYCPDDLVESIKTRKGFQAIPFDIDFVVRHGKKAVSELSEKMINNLILISSDNIEFRKLSRVVLINSSLNLKYELKKRLKTISENYLDSKRNEMMKNLSLLKKEDKLIDVEYD
jgi:hypothetical protein